ncbi:hydroxymethylbilane synthase [Tessaracoccus flavus]|uniref:Hydroxymethylbilane synthase n=1 Tax=Tessaracoccus flavus TaxID=1610493 RepID=A0A1Q2CDM2_9ACTN|nr:hydroxymethylbilane synthase [Tessaracoccus flavus]AQP44209.1 hydroxymethylbilane synthase [Tessaracoccus flavus]SDY38331.1 hydroxymethylbilane synthase [Tessaracoccus flavus]
MKLRLGTRGSALAMARSEAVAEMLRGAGHEVEIVKVSGHDTDTIHMPEGYSLGEFAKVLRGSLEDGQCDVVIHSVKDVPLTYKPGDLVFPAVLKRGDHRDALCTTSGVPLSALPRGSRVGITSLRRLAQLKALRPDLTFVDVVGTLVDRLRLLAPGELDGIVASAAGIQSLGLEDRVAEYLPIMTAPGQGALALECRAADEDVVAALAEFDDIETRICIDAERAVLTGLKTTYMAPVAAIATRRGILGLKAGVFSVDGAKRNVLEVGLPTSLYHAQRTGFNVANALLARKAERFISEEAIASFKMTADHAEDSSFIEFEDDDRLRVLLPRPEGRMSQALRANGLRVDCVALQEAKLVSADNRLDWGDWVVVPSAQTVWALRERGWDIPGDAKLAAMGTTTRLVVEEAGRNVDLCPEGPASSQKLVELFPKAEGKVRVVIPCADQFATRLEDGLRAKGYEVLRLEVYTMADLDEPDAKLKEMWDEGAWNAVFLVTPSQVRPYMELLGHRDDVQVVVWDDDTASAARAAGLPVLAVAVQKDDYGVAGLARALERTRS